MVPKITKTLNQVTPHQHPLVREVTNTNSTDHDGFICSGCETYGTTTGIRYLCKQQYCNFNLHEDCATCPKTLSTHIHPKHQLKLVWRFKDDLPCCDVCGDQVKGLYYSCPDASCNTFVLHPICSKFPSHVSHIIDRKHSLTFQSAVPSWCTICGDLCTSWRYRCGVCKIDIHLECVVIPLCHDPPNSGASTPKQQQQQQYQPPAPNYPPNKDNNYHQQHQYNYQQPPPPPMQQQQQQQQYHHHHHHHHHQEKRALPNHDFGYPVQKPPLECVVSPPCHDPPNSGASTPKQQQQQQYQPPAPNYPPNKDNNYTNNYHQQHQYNYKQPSPPPMQQQQQYHHHHHQEKRAFPNHDIGYPVQKPPLPHNYVYNQSSTFGIMPPPPVHHQCYYGQQKQQYYQQPPQFVAHPCNMHYQQQPDYHQGGGGGCGGGVATSSSSSTSSSGGRKRKMCLLVTRIVASVTVSAVLGVVGIPVPLFC